MASFEDFLARKYEELESENEWLREELRSRVPYDRYERRSQNLLGHIAECETALGRRREIVSNLGHRVSDLTNENAELRRRAMPEGCQWPRFEDGELVQIGATFAEKGTIENVVASVELSDDWFAIHGFDGAINEYSKGERVKRPAPAVLAADGEPLEVGQTVWHEDGTELRVLWFGDEEDGETIVRVQYVSGPTNWSEVRNLSITHTKPEIDSWERIEEDAESYDQQLDASWAKPDGCEVTALDIVRRCRALAERSEA